ncbi:MAG: MATE family efflux transporter, partial [Pseudomonadota bacterium]|nr:MATE family efflux transporter [Pseudomonadota bacterium]
LAFGGVFIDILSAVPEVRIAAREYLVWAALVPAVGVWSFQLDGIYIGSTCTVDMRNGMIISMAVFAIFAAALVPIYANHGLWLAFWIFMATRAATLGLWYPRLERSVDGV